MADVPTRAGVAGTYLQTVSYGYGASSGQGSAWFGPSAPMAPSAPADVAGRQFDYPVGYNLNTRPRVYEPIGFRDLRALADGYDLLRLAIETRKDQLSRMSWSIKSRDSEAKDKNDPRVKAITTFFQRPDGEHGWQDWLRPILEDLFVIDAPALYLRRDRGGRLVELVQIDGATIKPIIDDWGRTPRPYSEGGAVTYPPAYQQVLKGLPAVDYSTRDLLYRPRNRRIHTPYGFSAVEQIVTTVNIALRRQLSTLSHFTEGNIPDMLVPVPKEWTPDNIVTYQTHWDSYFTGDLGRRRRAKFVPSGTGSGGIHQTAPADLKGEFDEWLAKIVCFALSISPQALTKQMNRASADTQKQLSEEEGLEPILLWIKALIDDVIAYEFGAPDLAFTWDNDDEADETAQLAVLSGYVSKAIMTVNEARDRLGLDPLPDPEASQGMIITASGAVPLGSFAQQQEQSATNAKLMANAQAKQPVVQQGTGGAPKDDQGGAGARQEPATDGEVAKYSADQPRGKDGRFASGNDDGGTSAEKKPLLSTKTKIKIGTFLVSAAAVGIAISRNKPYVVHLPQHDAIRNLHTASVHTALSDAEKKAVHEYSNLHYAKINKKLRLGHKPDERINNIDAALDKSALSQDSVVYRGLNQDRSKRLLTKTQPGEVFVDRGYSSTSLSEGVARGFAATTDGGTVVLPKAKHGYVLSINVDKGTNALPLNDDIARHIAEQEVLLPRDSAFRVLRVDHDTKTVYAQHLGVKLGKAVDIVGVAENDNAIVEVGDKFVCCADDDLEFYPAPEGDTTAEDYADYTPPQPEAEKVAKADVSSEARGNNGEWTSGGVEGASTPPPTSEDWDTAKSIAKSVAIGAALTATAAVAVFLAPELFALAGGVAAGEAAAAAGATAAEAVSAATTAGRFVKVTQAVQGFAEGQYFTAGLKAGKLALTHLGFDTKAIETELRPYQDMLKASARAGVAPRLPEVMAHTADAFRDHLVNDLRKRYHDPHDADLIDAAAGAISDACDVYKARLATVGKAYTLGKRKLGTAWRSPEPIPFDRPATAKAEAAIGGRLTKALAALGANVATALRKVVKVAKAAPDDPDPEEVEDRARHRADDIVSEFDLGALYAEAEPIGADLEEVVNDTVARAVAQVGPDDSAGLVNQVNARAVAIARERAAELVGMHLDADGKLVPSDDAEMAITDTTRDMLRATIADDLAAGKTTDDIADDIAEHYAFSSERAAVIAATEVSRANSMAAQESYQAAADAGVPVKKRWLAEADCCDVCSANQAAGPIDLDDTFPSGDDTPPGHPNCRCSLTPVVGEPDQTDDE